MTSEKQNVRSDNTQNYFRNWHVICTPLCDTRLLMSMQTQIIFRDISCYVGLADPCSVWTHSPAVWVQSWAWWRRTVIALVAYTILPLTHGWSSLNGLWSAFPLDTANVQYHSHAVLDKSLSVSNVRHNSACYPKVSNAQWEELQSTLYSWVYKSRETVLERQVPH